MAVACVYVYSFFTASLSTFFSSVPCPPLSLCSGHVVLDRDSYSGTKPALGESWTYVADVRIALGVQLKDATDASADYTMTLTKSHRTAVGASVKYRITDVGIV